METPIEIIKLRQQTIGGSKAWVMAEEDLVRLISKYKLTLQGLLELGLSRSIWDNTLAYYGWDVNTVEGFRKRPYTQTRHGNSNYGFSSVIKDLHVTRAADTKIQGYLGYMEKMFPGFTEAYSAYHQDPTGVSTYLHGVSRKLLEANQVLKLIHHRVRKWANKVNKPYHKLLHSSLNHTFAKLLDELGVRYEVEVKVREYYFDFYLPDYRTFIEVDGGGHKPEKDEDKEGCLLRGDKLLRFKVRDTIALKHKHERIKNKIRKECGF
jgi:very-short-patch-repair endonuclease